MFDKKKQQEAADKQNPISIAKALHHYRTQYPSSTLSKSGSMKHSCIVMKENIVKNINMRLG